MSIKPLPLDVVNKIAAGEVIQRPVNALKELIENSVDAGATTINIIAKDGGLDLLQVADNGSGIHQSDLPLVCVRFATSKLDSYDGLQELTTHGFRGEALASISHAAFLSLITKTKDTNCAYKAEYLDGNIRGQPKPCAGNKGTLIIIEKLFYNMPLRRNSISSPTDEYARICDLVTKYATHYSNVSFTLKKSADSILDVKTKGNAFNADVISVLYGSNISKELLEVNSIVESLHFSMHACFTHPNYNSKRYSFLLFINNRLVDCTPLKKSLDNLYASFLPKNTHPFIYIALDIKPNLLDVNVHPTKKEVKFLYEEEMIDSICVAIDKALLNCKQSRNFEVKQISSTAAIDLNVATSRRESLPQQNMVRNDYSLQTLDVFLNSSQENISEKENFSQMNDSLIVGRSSQSRREIKLTSVLELRKQIEMSMDKTLRKVISNSTFVGCIDPSRCIIQYETDLLFVNMHLLSIELFYQLVLYNFGNLGLMRLSEPAPIYALALLALQHSEDHQDLSEVSRESKAKEVVDLYIRHSEMLEDYFSIIVNPESQTIDCLPYCLDGFYPSLEALPFFIINFAFHVNWNSEKECFKTAAIEIAKMYSPSTEFWQQRLEGIDGCDKTTSWKWVVQNIVMPACKASLQPSASLKNCIKKLVGLPDLYKVFERC